MLVSPKRSVGGRWWLFYYTMIGGKLVNTEGEQHFKCIQSLPIVLFRNKTGQFI